MMQLASRVDKPRKHGPVILVHDPHSQIIIVRHDDAIRIVFAVKQQSFVHTIAVLTQQHLRAYGVRIRGFHVVDQRRGRSTHLLDANPTDVGCRNSINGSALRVVRRLHCRPQSSVDVVDPQRCTPKEDAILPYEVLFGHLNDRLSIHRPAVHKHIVK
ncbi:hypothetical protein L917_01576, partial [Phytophthora nicotianae]